MRLFFYYAGIRGGFNVKMIVRAKRTDVPVAVCILLAHIFQAISCAHKTISINKRIMIELVLLVRSHAFVLNSTVLQIPAAVILFSHTRTSHIFHPLRAEMCVFTSASRNSIQRMCYCVNIAM